MRRVCEMIRDEECRADGSEGSDIDMILSPQERVGATKGISSRTMEAEAFVKFNEEKA